VIFHTMEKEDGKGAEAFLTGQAESLLKRGGFKIKKNVVFKVKDRAEVAPFVAVSPSGTEIVVDCDEVTTETNQFVRPILEKLQEKRTRLGVEKVLLVTAPKLATKPGFDHVIGVLSYAAQGVYYWDSYELKRLSSLNDAELAAEILKSLKLVWIKDGDGVFRAGDGKDAPTQDPNSISSTIKDVLSAAPPISPRNQSGPTEADATEQPQEDFFSDKALLLLIGGGVLCLLVGLFFFWKTIEELLSGLSNIMGLLVLILLIIGLSLYSTD
jgi:hypothetical protein